MEKYHPRLRAETPACMEGFGKGKHFGVQARTMKIYYPPPPP